MKHTTAQILRQACITDRVVGVHDDPQVSADVWRSFLGYVPAFAPPDVGDDVLAFFDTEGRIDGRQMRSGEYEDKKGVQVRCRSAAYTTGWQMLDKVREYLDSIGGIVVALEGASYHIQAVHRTSGILSLGRSPGSRTTHEFTLNVNVTIKET